MKTIIIADKNSLDPIEWDYEDRKKVLGIDNLDITYSIDSDFDFSTLRINNYILVVEDENTTFFNIASYISESRSAENVVIIKNGDSFHKIIQNLDIPPLIMSLDFNLGDKDNMFSITESIYTKFKNKFPNTPVIGYTNYESIYEDNPIFSDSKKSVDLLRSKGESVYDKHTINSSFAYGNIVRDKIAIAKLSGELQKKDQIIQEQNKQLELLRLPSFSDAVIDGLSFLYRGDSDEAKLIHHFTVQYAKCDLPVLLLGETGTGKDLLARDIHRISNRTGKYVPINCAAIPEGMAEGLLFGSEKGAYTDARQKFIGYFEQAHNGTLFLDEFADLTPRVQVKVLRAIETHEITRLGSSEPIKINVRIICATSQDLQKYANENAFRKDLFFRVGGLFPEITPLREKKDDIWYYFDEVPELKKISNKLDHEAKKAIVEADYGWPAGQTHLN